MLDQRTSRSSRRMNRGGKLPSNESEEFDRGPNAGAANKKLFDSRLDSSVKKRTSNHHSTHNNHHNNHHNSTKSYDIRPTEYNLSSLENLLNEVQRTYFDIAELEDRCENLIKEVQDGVTEDEWNRLYFSQFGLLQKYYDFLFLTNHPFSNTATKSLIKKYKIPLRMWNKGIFKFLDLLRNHKTQTYSLILRFSLDCFTLLTLLTEPPYESRNMWLEALGDIARFSMVLGSSSMADWKKIAQFWYQRAMIRSPGVGRLYHHSAVVCSHKIDSLFYFCKALTCNQPFSPAVETIQSLFNTNSGDQNLAIRAYLKLHQHMFDNNNQMQFEEKLSSFMELLTDNQQQVDSDHLVNRGFCLAVCNITALMDYGTDPNNRIWQYFNRGEWKRSFKKESQNAKDLAFKTLKAFLHLPIEQTLSHILVWLYFLNSLAENKALFNEFISDPAFPKTEFDWVLAACQKYAISTMNSNDQSVIPSIVKWKRVLTDTYPPSISGIKSNESCDLLARINRQSNDEAGSFIPSYKQRPLPEEIELLGFLWPPKSMVNVQYVADSELSMPSSLYPGFSNTHDVLVVRPFKAIELIYQLADKCDWLLTPSSDIFFGNLNHQQRRFKTTILPREYNLLIPSTITNFSEANIKQAQWVFDIDIWYFHLEQIRRDIHNFANINVPLITVRQLKYCSKDSQRSDSFNATNALDYIVENYKLGKVSIFTSERVLLRNEDDIVQHADELDSCHPGGYINVPDVFREFLILSKQKLGSENVILLSNDEKTLQSALTENIMCARRN